MSALGNLFVNLTLNHAQYTAALTKSEHQAQEFANRSKKHISDFEKSAQQSFASLTKSVVGIGAGLLSFNALKTTFDKAVNQLDQIDKIAQKTGSSFGELSRQQQALARAGEDFTAAYAAGLNKLSQNLGKFDADTNKVLKALGVNTQDATGKLRNAADVSRDVAFALQKYEDGAGKAAAVTALFGKSGVELIPVLNDLADQYQHVTGVSEKFGKNVQQFNDLMDVAAAQSTFLGQSMAVGLLPSLNSIGEGFKKVGFDAGNFGQIIGEGLGRVLRVTAATVTGFVAVVSGAGAAVRALLSGDFANVGNAFTAASGKYDGMIKSFLNGGGVIEQSTIKIEQQKLSLNGLMLKTDEAEGATKRLAKAKKEQISDADRFLQSLNKEVETLNKNTFEIKKLEAAKLGLSKVADPLIDKIQRETEAHKKQSDAMQKGISITQQMRTKEEQFSDTQKELNDLLKGGAITQETYNRALSKASDELKKVDNVASSTFPKMEEFAIQASRNIQNAFSNSIRLGLEGDFKGMFSSFKSALLAMVAEAAALDLAGAIFGKKDGKQGSYLMDMFGSLGGGSGKSGSNAAGSGNFLKGLLGLGGVAGSSGAAANAFDFMSFMGGSGTALGGASDGLMASLAPIAGAAGALLESIALGSAIGGSKKVFGVNSMTSAAIGAVLGGPIGALVGGSINAIFGHGPLKQKETNLIGSFGADGFDGVTSTKWKAQGGLLVGDKVIRIVADTETGEVISGASKKLQEAATEAGKLAQEIGRFVEGQWLPIVDEFKLAADKLGIAEDALKDFNFQINIASEKGKALTQEQIGEQIAIAADNLARKLIPGIDDLREGAETAAQAFDRLGVEFDALVKLAVAGGMDLATATSFLQGTTAQERDAFYDRLGVKDLGPKLDRFISNFAPPAEQQRILSDQVKALISPFGVGLTAVDTREELFSIARSLNLNTEDGRSAFKVLMDNQDVFLAYADQQAANLELEREIANEQRKLSREASKELKQAAADLAKVAEDARAKAKESFQASLLNGIFDPSLALASSAPGELLSKFLGRSFKPGEFNAGQFNFAYAQAIAEASKGAADFASTNALKIGNVGGLLGQLGRAASSPSLINPMVQEIIRSGLIASGVGSSTPQYETNRTPQYYAIRDALAPVASLLAGSRARRLYQSRGQGIASVLAAQDDVSFASASGVIGGREQFGADVLAYGQALDRLTKDFNSGKIKADAYNKSIEFLNDQFGSDTVSLLNDTAAQLERIQSANRRLGSAGLNSIQFYFKQITDSVKELGAGLSEPAQQVSESVGRLNSLGFVLGKSASAAISGFTKGGRLDIVSQITRAGGSASIAQTIARAAGIAGNVLNTQQGQLLKAKLDQDNAFKGANTKDLALLIEGVRAFDPASFENAFNNINAALIKKQINEAQFTKLFNTSLDVFEGLSDAAGSSAAALADLRKAARDVADELLGNQSKNIFSPTQSFQVAEQQFNDTIRRAKAGDATAAGQLGPMANALLAAGQNSLADQTSLIGYVQANLRSVAGAGATARLDVDPKVQAQLDAQEKRLTEQQKINLEIKLALDDIRQSYRKWENLGLPTTAI